MTIETKPTSSRLFQAGLWIFVMGAVALVLGRTMGRSLEEVSELLLFAVGSLGLGLLVGPVMCFLAYTRHRRAGESRAPASAKIWVPISLVSLLINIPLAMATLSSNIPERQRYAMALSQVILIPGIGAIIALVPKSGRSLGRTAKVFAIISILLGFSNLFH